MIIKFRLNRRAMSLDVEPGLRVIDLLRNELGLSGTKEGCGQGECGACTILVDGQAKLSCLMLAAQLEGREVQSIEGLAKAKDSRPLLEAFAEHGAVQCGYCTPGMIVSAKALLESNPEPSREAARQAISGNLCRCTGYVKIVDAIVAAGKPKDEMK